MNKYLAELKENGIVIIENFLSKKECSNILNELNFTRWGKSVVVKYNGDELSPAYSDKNLRQSETAGQYWFTDELNDCLAAAEEKIAAILETDINHFEEWQANKYTVTDKFDYHVDCGNWANSKAGERKRTLLLYLDTPEVGGETHFRALNRTIVAQQGKLLIWNNLLPTGKCNFGMIHAGLPVIKGTKTIMVSWEREHQLR